MILNLRKSYGQFITSGFQLLFLIVGIKANSRAVWIVCLVLMAVLSLFAWYSTLRRRRAITDMPTSRIASAAQGYVELSGTGRPLDDSPLLSHLTQRPCLWYRWRVEEKNGRSWKTVDSGESQLSFLIDDGSGRCVVDVENAEILTRYGNTWRRGDHRYTEWNLLIDDRIYALGEFRTLGGGMVDLDARRDVSELLSAWKTDQPALLGRFDLDGNGELNEKEWGLARQAARREVSRMHREARDESGVHTLSRPRNGRYYLLSNIDPNRLARRYLLWSIFHLAVFLGALGEIPWALQFTDGKSEKILRYPSEGMRQGQ
ncbi:MAG: E3 ubiquitin ligase family protein [Candidatus Accumulibacter sp.]|jgi:hypothetical protein|nr:E3 ubiquitin ligase family protein [Accumulibacter sp.]